MEFHLLMATSRFCRYFSVQQLCVIYIEPQKNTTNVSTSRSVVVFRCNGRNVDPEMLRLTATCISELGFLSQYG